MSLEIALVSSLEKEGRLWKVMVGVGIPPYPRMKQHSPHWTFICIENRTRASKAMLRHQLRCVSRVISYQRRMPTGMQHRSNKVSNAAQSGSVRPFPLIYIAMTQG
ncbi:hypothetical protein TNCV_5098661 [Trichonephila clavipes]|uniref:Uncharacterized protein n=1 Tax=Trichonephila clavipes TaxID=2585209 RepID=A0A8X6S039_TRICX|nr:hypothetical protein TNCV_5098661 [Trichonephila clavipes]